MTGHRVGGAIGAMWMALGLGVTACQPADAAKATRADSAELARRQARLEQALRAPTAGAIDSTAESRRDSSADAIHDTISGVSDTSNQKGGAIARWVLPRELDEISGIALTSDGRLLAHGDERAQVSEIDYRRGVVVKQFVVGQPTIRSDLEGITVANDVVFMLASNGKLYEFREGANGARVDYITYDTRLGEECEFEGLAFDPTLNSLLLACKEVEDKDLRDSMVIYRWKLTGGGERVSRLTVPLSRILPAIGKKEFHAADITVDPRTGNYVVIASIEEALVQITPSGDVLSARKLAGQHNQPEAIAITKDGILIIGDEAGRRPAAITLYPWPQ